MGNSCNHKFGARERQIPFSKVWIVRKRKGIILQVNFRVGSRLRIYRMREFCKGYRNSLRWRTVIWNRYNRLWFNRILKIKGKLNLLMYQKELSPKIRGFLAHHQYSIWVIKGKMKICQKKKGLKVCYLDLEKAGWEILM